LITPDQIFKLAFCGTFRAGLAVLFLAWVAALMGFFDR